MVGPKVGASTLKIESDQLLVDAGECFMFLLWVESVLVDLLVLAEGDRDLRNRYNAKGPHPIEFSQRRFELKALDISEITRMFLDRWPQWKDDQEVYHSLHRISLWRNAFGHAQVQPFREYLLYHPKRWERIEEHMRCGSCYKFLKDCECPSASDLSDPPCLKLDEDTIVSVYLDIRQVDRCCFFPTAVKLDVKYRGIAWLDQAPVTHLC